MRFFNRCKGCNKLKIVLWRRTIKLPTGDVAKAQDYICGRCVSRLQRAVTSGVAKIS